MQVDRQFQVGDNAVYPAHGVAQITGIESRDIAGQKKEFYILKILDTDMKLMIPTDGAHRAGAPRVSKVPSRPVARRQSRH